MKKYLFVLVGLLALIGIKDVYALSSEQKALVETMDAFNRKGRYIQYDGYRASSNTYPELATSQNTVYTHCSNFAYSVYKDALGIETPFNSSLIAAHAYHDDESEDIIRFWNKDELTSYKNTYASNHLGFVQDIFATDIQVGDLVVTFRESAAHTMVVYSIIYGNNNEVTDVILMESNSRYETESTKLGTNGLSYNTDGSIRTIDIKSRLRPFLFNNTNNDYLYLMIVRPLAVKNRTGENKYINAKCDRTPNANIYVLNNFTCTTTQKDFAITDTAKSRMKYSNIDIDKTITNDNGIINGSDVDLGEEITYSIKITNNSDSVYSNLVVKENVSNYVDIVSNDGTLKDNTITWTINVEAGKSKTVTYKVKVKNKVSYVGKEVVSTGFVDNIKTPPIKNKITFGFTKEDKDKIKETYNSLKTNTDKAALEFINDIYVKAFDIDLKLNELELDKLIESDLKSNDPLTININSSNKFSSLIYANYYGALKYSSNVYNMKHWEDNWMSNGWNGTKVEGRSPRKDYIYKEHFETGDILVFSNTNDSKTNDDGVYAYIFIDDSFYGINKDDKNEFSTSATLSNGNTYLNTLFGKDYYVVLRPSYLINKVEEVEVPDTNMNTGMLALLLASVFIVTGASITIPIVLKKK